MSAEAARYAVVVRERLTLRRGDQTLTIWPGTWCDVWAERADGWLWVQTATGVVGWLHGDYVERIDDDSATTDRN